MNIIINRPQLVRTVLLYLNKNFGKLLQKTIPKYPNIVFYINSDYDILMEYDKNTDFFHIAKEIWTKIESLFYLNYDDVKLIMKLWLEGAYNLKGVTPVMGHVDFDNWWLD